MASDSELRNRQDGIGNKAENGQHAQNVPGEDATVQDLSERNATVQNLPEGDATVQHLAAWDTTVKTLPSSDLTVINRLIWKNGRQWCQMTKP